MRMKLTYSLATIGFVKSSCMLVTRFRDLLRIGCTDVHAMAEPRTESGESTAGTLGLAHGVLQIFGVPDHDYSFRVGSRCVQ